MEEALPNVRYTINHRDFAHSLTESSWESGTNYRGHNANAGVVYVNCSFSVANSIYQDNAHVTPMSQKTVYFIKY